MRNHYDVAVIGAGVFGAWTAYHLQRRGQQVALIDAYGPANNRASSGGESRIIRMGYGAEELYTRMSNRSLAQWLGLFERAGRPELFQRTGVLWMAREGDPYTQATLETHRRVGIEHEELHRAELEARYPQIDFGDVTWAIYEPGSGGLLARRAVQTVVDQFVAQGGEMIIDALPAPRGSGSIDQLTGVHGTEIVAEKYVYACGPWLPKLFPALLGERIHPTRQEVYFFGVPAGEKSFAPPLMPTWIDFGAEMYGLPDLENRGFKIALDRHGEPIDPDTAERDVTPAKLEEVREFVARRFPALKHAPLVEARVCQYENTSNGDFLIDQHPDFSNLWLVGGGSGHGFKHGPVVGEFVAKIVASGEKTIERFSLSTKAKFRRRSVF